MENSQVTNNKISLKSFVNKWGTRVSWSLFDQAIFSGTNFVGSFLLGRWLSENDYGIFSIAFTVFLFLAGFPSALVWEPMTVFCGRYQNTLKNYLGKHLWYQLLLSVLFSIVSIGLSFFLVENIRTPFLFVFVSMPFILLIWFYRQVAYLQMQPRDAFFMSLCYSILYLSIVAVSKEFGQLSTGTVFLGMALASFGASILGSKLTGISLVIKESFKLNFFHEDWVYGKYILIASIASSVSSLAFIPLMGLFIGLAEVGAFRAMQNLILPLQQIIIALSLILLPQLAMVTNEKGEKAARQIINYLLVLSVLVVIAYGIFLWLSGNLLVGWLYHKAYFLEYTWLLPALSFAFIFTAVAQILGIGMRALKKPDAVLWSKAAAAFTVIVVGVWAIYRWQLLGSMIALLLSVSSECVIIVMIYVRKRTG